MTEATETNRWVPGWSMPHWANHWHVFITEQIKLCPDSYSSSGRRKRAEHTVPVIPLGEPVDNACASCSSILAKLEYWPLPEPEAVSGTNGVTFLPTRGQTRIEVQCDHQHGLVYVVDGAEMNWVCSSRRRPAHSLSGFFRELVEMKDPRIKELMNRWGLYYRPLPLAEQATEVEGATP